MSTRLSSIKHLRIGTLISISSFVASAILSSSPLYGQTVSFAGMQTTVQATGLSRPQGVAVNRAGDVFAADAFNHHRVIKVPANGGPQTTVGTGLGAPYGLAIDSAGDLFIADLLKAHLIEVPVGGGPQISVGTGLSEPEGVAVDSAGNVFIADTGNQRVVKIPAGGGTQTTVGSGWNRPVAVAVDSGGDVFVGDGFYGDVVEVLAGSGAQHTVINGLFDVGGIAVDGVGDLFVANEVDSPDADVVEVLASDGVQATLGTGLNAPVGVALDQAGSVFIADSLNNRVVEIQRSSVNFGHVNVCAPGQTSPAPCREILALTYYVTSSGTLGTPAVLTGGALDFPFTLAPGSTCTGAVSAGATCTVNVKFKAAFAGERDGVVQITDASGNVLASTLVYGNADHSGFTANSMALNGAASIVGTSLVLTDGGPNEAASAYDPTPVFVQKFTTAFDFQLTKAKGDGFTFTILNVGNLYSTGGHGGGLGYEGLTPSAAIKFDLYNNAGEGINSTGLYLDGAAPTAGAIDLTGTGIDLHSGDQMHAGISYDGTTLTLTLTDLATGATWLHPFTVDIPRAVGGDTAYVGFTAATGSSTAIQWILDWQFTPEN